MIYVLCTYVFGDVFDNTKSSAGENMFISVKMCDWITLLHLLDLFSYHLVTLACFALNFDNSHWKLKHSEFDYYLKISIHCRNTNIIMYVLFLAKIFVPIDISTNSYGLFLGFFWWTDTMYYIIVKWEVNYFDAFLKTKI